MGTSVIDNNTVTTLRHVLANLCGGGEGPVSADLAPLRIEVRVAGLRKSVTLTPDELANGYVPLMRVLIEAHRSAGQRIVAGLAGIPGSGKSTLAAVLAELWRPVCPEPVLAVIGMDGWHLPNAVLDRRTFVAADGSTMPLRGRKGSPPSFDVERLASDLRRCRDAHEDVPVPVYDRTRHEPVPGASVVPAEAGLVLIEGNYLLNDDGLWAEVAAQIDLPLWLEIDPDACREGIVARHVAGGMSADRARAKYEENDRPNAELALAGRARADWRIQLDRKHAFLALCPS